MKLKHVQCDMLPIVTQYVMSSLKAMLITIPDPGYGIIFILTT